MKTIGFTTSINAHSFVGDLHDMMNVGDAFFHRLKLVFGDDVCNMTLKPVSQIFGCSHRLPSSTIRQSRCVSCQSPTGRRVRRMTSCPMCNDTTTMVGVLP